MSRNILVIGSGAREHALAWKLLQSRDAGTIYVAPGNAGTASIATNLAIKVNDTEAIEQSIREHDISLTVVGPEDPLANGLGDYLRSRGHLVFGPDGDGARIESSKSWAKDVMDARSVPTGSAVTVDSLQSALDHIYDAPLPIVIKADGLAAGKGVVICETREEAEAAVRSMMEDRQFGDAGGTLLIEEFLTGMEVSLLALVDDSAIVPLMPACDYKPVGEGNTGLNTGGMGAYAPPAIADETFVSTVVDTIIRPVVDEMAARGITYRGVLYAGLIVTDEGPKVIEFNCRFGDPEVQVVLPLLKSDLLEVCDAVARGQLAELPPLQWESGASVGVVVAAGGYPGPYESGRPIEGLDDVPEGGLIFHAGTAAGDGLPVTSGGRVLSAVATGRTMREARDLAYETAGSIRFDGAFYRRDIADREIND